MGRDHLQSVNLPPPYRQRHTDTVSTTGVTDMPTVGEGETNMLFRPFSVSF